MTRSSRARQLSARLVAHSLSEQSGEAALAGKAGCVEGSWWATGQLKLQGPGARNVRRQGRVTK